MLMFKKKKPKIVCKIEWIHHGYRKYVKVNFGWSGQGICPKILQVGSGREIVAPRRNKQIWQVYPTKSTASFCLRITQMKFHINSLWRFDFWNTRQPKHISRMTNVENRLSVGKKYTTLKRRIEKWK